MFDYMNNPWIAFIVVTFLALLLGAGWIKMMERVDDRYGN